MIAGTLWNSHENLSSQIALQRKEPYGITTSELTPRRSIEIQVRQHNFISQMLDEH